MKFSQATRFRFSRHPLASISPDAESAIAPTSDSSQGDVCARSRFRHPVLPNERYAVDENANGERLVRCPVCGTERICRGRRSKRVYCSDACRARAWRQRTRNAGANVSAGPESHAQNAQNSASGSAEGNCVHSERCSGRPASDSPAESAATQRGVIGGDRDA